MKIPKLTPATGNRTRDLIIVKPTLYLTTTDTTSHQSVVNIGKYLPKKGKIRENNECHKALVIFADLSLFRPMFPHINCKIVVLPKMGKIRENHSCLTSLVISADLSLFRPMFPHINCKIVVLPKKGKIRENNSCLTSLVISADISHMNCKLIK